MAKEIEVCLVNKQHDIIVASSGVYDVFVKDASYDVIVGGEDYSVHLGNTVTSCDIILENVRVRTYIEVENEIEFGFNVTDCDVITQLGLCTDSIVLDSDCVVYSQKYLDAGSQIIVSQTATDSATKFISLQASSMEMNVSAEISSVVYRRLADMDDSALSTFNQMTLNDVYFIS